MMYGVVPLFGVYWWSTFDPRDSNDTVPNIINKDPSKIRIEGKIADEICIIVGSQCPPYYIGNIQEDGSIMVGITISDVINETQYVFLIKNETLSYEEYKR